MVECYCELCKFSTKAVGFIYRESAGRDIPVCADHMKEGFDPAGDAEKRGWLRGLEAGAALGMHYAECPCDKCWIIRNAVTHLKKIEEAAK